MNNGFLKTTNILNVVASIILPVIFVIGNLHNLLYVFGNTLLSLILLLAYAIVATTGNLGSIIQGIRLIANGKAKTSASAAIFRIILYASHFIAALRLLNTKGIGKINGQFQKTFMIIFGVMILLSVIRLIISKQHEDEDGTATGSSGTAIKVFLLVVVAPAAFIGLSIFIIKFMESHAGVSKVLSIIATVIISLIAIGVFAFIVSVIGNLFSSPSSSSSSRKSSSSSSADRNKRNDDLRELEYAKKEREKLRNQRAFAGGNEDTSKSFYGKSNKDFDREIKKQDDKINSLKDRLRGK